MEHEEYIIRMPTESIFKECGINEIRGQFIGLPEYALNVMNVYSGTKLILAETERVVQQLTRIGIAYDVIKNIRRPAD